LGGFAHLTSSEALYLYAEKLLSPKLLTSFYPNLHILAMLLSRTLPITSKLK